MVSKRTICFAAVLLLVFGSAWVVMDYLAARRRERRALDVLWKRVRIVGEQYRHVRVNNAFDDEDAKLLVTQLENVVSLQLWGSQVGDRGLVYVLAGSPQLLSLNCRRTSISARGFVGLRCQHLQVLDLSQTAVDDEVFIHLQGLIELQTLRLSESRVSGRSLSRLRHTALWELDLSGCRLSGDVGHEITNLPSLRCLSVSSTDVGNEFLSSISTTDISDLRIAKTKIDDRGISHLSALPLQRLILAECRISDEGITHLTSETLQVLDISKTRVSEKCLIHLAKLPALRELWIDDALFSADAIREFKTKRPKVAIVRSFWEAMGVGVK